MSTSDDEHHPVVQLVGIHQRYDGEHEVLRGVDLALCAGASVAVRGRS